MWIRISLSYRRARIVVRRTIGLGSARTNQTSPTTLFAQSKFNVFWGWKQHHVLCSWQKSAKVWWCWAHNWGLYGRQTRASSASWNRARNRPPWQMGRTWTGGSGTRIFTIKLACRTLAYFNMFQFPLFQLDKEYESLMAELSGKTPPPR